MAKCGNCKESGKTVEHIKECYGITVNGMSPAEAAAQQASEIAAEHANEVALYGDASQLTAQTYNATKGHIPEDAKAYAYAKAAAMETADAASAKQVGYVRSLNEQRQVPVAGKTTEEADIIARFEDLLGGHKFVSKHEASQVIEWLKGQPKRQQAASSYAAEAKRGDVHVVDGTYYRIHIAQKSGNAYAAQAHIDAAAQWAEDGTLVKAGTIRWEYMPGLIKKLNASTLTTAAQAAAFGRLVGRCCFCSHAIDTPESTAVGYGPVCASKYGLHWGDAVQAAQ